LEEKRKKDLGWKDSRGVAIGAGNKEL